MRCRSLFRAAGLIAVAFGMAGCGVPGPATPAAAMDPLRRSLSLDGLADGGAPVTVSYLTAGDPSGIRLILVHGTPGAADGWADFLADPPPGVEVVALDRPGFGDSGPEGAVTALDGQADAVAALLPDDGRPAILLGHSLGGPIAALAAARHPERVSALILLAASLDPDLERIHPMQRVGAWAPVRAVLPRPIRNANAELFALKPELEALRPELARVRCPVLIVHGTDDDLVPFSNAAYAEAHLTGACRVETVVLDGADHFLPWNAASTVRAAIARAEGMEC
ncbi:alpha/beta fold hydrolase [Skermanella pratensis]|uniref:alpha/beta fold hydrolase n=1 Tax=Skermanella pratensis TaxID=2233999 RepID=UPI00130198EE|nr:alpha/beta fold hydrolase [Skermanella pratensis]